MLSYVLGGVFSLEIIDERPGLSILKITGQDLNIFNNESGGHRFQRIPPNEKRGRVHTSTITIAVLPEPTSIELTINDKDLEWNYVRGSGAGGQARNKTSNCVMLKYKPTGLVIRCESERSQHYNKISALATLRARLWAERRSNQAQGRDASRKAQMGSGMRGDKRRTIRQQDGIVKDHLTGKTWSFENYRRGIWD